MKTSAPKWSILVPTVVDRAHHFERLANKLKDQVAALNGAVEVVVFWNNYERQIGAIRQLMLEDARGEYINFIDDDDLVTDDYCHSVFTLLDGVDYIGFMVDFYQNGRHNGRPVIHSLKCSGWYDDSEGFYRRVTHVNPVRRELALRYAGYDKSDYKKNVPEDELYAQNMDAQVKTEHFIARPIHQYMQTDDHAWNRFEGVGGKLVRPELPKHFRFHPLSTEVA